MGELVSMHENKGGRRWWNLQDEYNETGQVQVNRQPAAEHP